MAQTRVKASGFHASGESYILGAFPSPAVDAGTSKNPDPGPSSSPAPSAGSSGDSFDSGSSAGTSSGSTAGGTATENEDDQHCRPLALQHDDEPPWRNVSDMITGKPIALLTD